MPFPETNPNWAGAVFDQTEITTIITINQIKQLKSVELAKIHPEPNSTSIRLKQLVVSISLNNI